MPLLNLSDVLLEHIFGNVQLNHMDLLRIARTCHRLHDLVQQADNVWEQMYCASFGCLPEQPTQHFRELFKEKCMERQREQRLQLRVDRMRLQSTIFWLQQELKDARQQLRAEQRQQHQLAGRLRELQHARLAKSGAQQWQLSGVQLYFNKVVQAQAVPVEAELANVQQQQKVCHLELKTLENRIQQRQQQLDIQRRKLAALQG